MGLPQKFKSSFSPYFSSADIINLPWFAGRLKQISQFDPVSRYLVSRLSDSTKVLLSKYQGAEDLPLREALVRELNRIIKSGYIGNVAYATTLPGKTGSLFGKIQDLGSVLLNRLMLERAYPGAIAKMPFLLAWLRWILTGRKDIGPFLKDNLLLLPHMTILVCSLLILYLLVGILPVLPLVLLGIGSVLLAIFLGTLISKQRRYLLIVIAFVFPVVISVIILAASVLGRNPYTSFVLKMAREKIFGITWVSLLIIGIVIFLAWSLFIFLGIRLQESVRERSEALLVKFSGWVLGLTAFVIWGAGAIFALGVLLQSPPLKRLQIIQANFVSVRESKAFMAAGGIDMPSDYAVVMRGYYDPEDFWSSEVDKGELVKESSLEVSSLPTFILAKDNVIVVNPDSSKNRVFEQPIPDLTDMLVISGEDRLQMVLVVAGRRLGRSDGNGKFVKIADLPAEGLRFGQRICDYGVASEILLFGQVGGKGMVFGLSPEGEYLKIAEVDGTVTAATGFFNSTIIAVGGELLCLTPGKKPKVLFRVPAGYGPVTSVLACVPTDEDIDKALFLVAMPDGVFGVENGLGYLLVAGIGGELRLGDVSRYSAWLADGKRHAAVILTLRKIAKVQAPTN